MCSVLGLCVDVAVARLVVVANVVAEIVVEVVASFPTDSGAFCPWGFLWC